MTPDPTLAGLLDDDLALVCNLLSDRARTLDARLAKVHPNRHKGDWYDERDACRDLFYRLAHDKARRTRARVAS